MIFRIMRKDYDKPHRCPGWSGPGYKLIRESVCNGGSLSPDFYGRFWSWKFHRHLCGVLTLPHMFRWLEPRTYLLKWKFRR